MTPLAWWLLLFFLAGPVGWVASLIRRDHNRTLAAEARAKRADRRADAAEQHAAVCEQHARDWAAIADERAVELENHLARCLGELVHNDSGVKR